MRIFHTKNEIAGFRTRQTKLNHKVKIGFVPTMGALHEAHLSLVRESKQNDDITIVSIFVNPTQFNNANDLKSYPRMLNDDLQKLSTLLTENDVVFAPDDSEIYPEKDTRTFDFGNLDKVLEGKFRPGHFNGVAQVVSRLFEIVKPDRAYFGEKDFQQLAIIRMLVGKYMSKSGIEIIPVKTMRETDGLAMSSRNMRLTKEQRKQAPEIFKALSEIKHNQSKNDIKNLINKAVETINANTCLEVEYLEVVDDETFETIQHLNKKCGKVICTAVFAGNVRLIDNIRL